ncbi:MAG: nitroreductase family protein [Bifidobacteriaceae bacterium]|jgi:hypothetical protein|nr:nitroreductase family protein [Bifidobacteriaceae bacterium]
MSRDPAKTDQSTSDAPGGPVSDVPDGPISDAPAGPGRKRPAAARTAALVVALVVVLMVAAVGWAGVIWLNYSRPARPAIDTRAELELKPVLTDTESAIIEALERRNSALAGDFTDKPVTDPAQLALAWAATGLNRGGSGFVVPLAMHAEPYVSVYLATAAGVSRYDWATNKLVSLTEADVRSNLVTQGYAKQAPCLMLLVIDQDKVKGNTNNGYIAVGAMTQNVYLLADELNIQARYVESIEADQWRDPLNLTASQIPVGGIVLATK